MTVPTVRFERRTQSEGTRWAVMIQERMYFIANYGEEKKLAQRQSSKWWVLVCKEKRHDKVQRHRPDSTIHEFLNPHSSHPSKSSNDIAVHDQSHV